MPGWVETGRPELPASATCGGCRAAGRCRLGLSGWRVDPATSSASTSGSCPSSHAGGPQIAHGGWTAAVFDDVVGRLLTALGERVVTAELAVRFSEPVPVDHDVRVVARVCGRDGRRTTVSAELRLAEDGRLLASADAVLVAVDDRHYARHAARLDELGRQDVGRAEPACTADEIAAALPAPLRATFVAEHRRLLEVWQAQASRQARPARADVPRVEEPPGWAGLMDDWEL